MTTVSREEGGFFFVGGTAPPRAKRETLNLREIRKTPVPRGQEEWDKKGLGSS